jgi:hypothetical protein
MDGVTIRSPKEPYMIPPLDIFRKEEGNYLWKASAENFELAKSKVAQLAERAPGEYMIFSQTTGNKTLINSPEQKPQ